MRIAIDATCWENRRGYGRFTRELIIALAARFSREHELILLTDQITASRNLFPEGTQVHPVETRVQPLEAASSDGSRSLPDLLRFGWANRRLRPDVLFLPTVYSYFPILGRTPMLVCIHDAMPEKKPELFFDRDRSRHLWNAKLFLARQQARIIACPSHQARRDVATAFGLPLSSLALIGEGPAPVFVPREEQSAGEAIRARFHLPLDQPLILYVGGISPHKNLAGLVRGLSRVPGAWHLAIVGECALDRFLTCRDELVATIEELDLSDRVTLTGFVEEDDLVTLYNMARMLVLPSFDEGFGLTAVEAMACGTPVAHSGRGAIPEVVEDAGIAFDTSNPADIATVIERLLRDDALRAELSRRGLRRAGQLNWGKAAEQTMELLQQTAKTGAGGRPIVRQASSFLRHLGALVRERIHVSPTARADIVREFHRLYYNSWHHLNQDTTKLQWLGTTTLKCPLDLWIYQEILFELEPDLVIETGTYAGGSARYLAGVLEQCGGDGRVVSIDVREPDNFPVHPQITYLTGSSTSPEIVEQVRALAASAKSIVCFLDSDHGKDHVLAELRIYADLVTVGSYLVVEDTNVNGHPVHPDHGPGPMEAVEAFLAEDDRYVVDPTRERLLLTMNPRGYLKRIR